MSSVLCMTGVQHLSSVKVSLKQTKNRVGLENPKAARFITNFPAFIAAYTTNGHRILQVPHKFTTNNWSTVMCTNFVASTNPDFGVHRSTTGVRILNKSN